MHMRAQDKTRRRTRRIEASCIYLLAHHPKETDTSPDWQTLPTWYCILGPCLDLMVLHMLDTVDLVVSKGGGCRGTPTTTLTTERRLGRPRQRSGQPLMKSSYRNATSILETLMKGYIFSR